MTPLPRGTCPVCGRKVALRRGRRMREHRPVNVERDSGREVGLGGVSRPSGVCLGSGLMSSGLTSLRPENWELVERWIERYPDDWRLLFRRGDETLEVQVSEDVWRAFDSRAENSQAHSDK